MLLKKFLYRFALMPTCTVNIQPDGISPQPLVKMSQNLEESISVTSLCLNHTHTTQKWGYPSRNIQTLLMLAGGRNLQPLSNASPYPPQTRMKGKTTFILKNNGFFLSQRFKFFLKPCKIALHLQPLLAYTHDWHALTYTPTGASSSGLDELSALHQTAVASGSSGWGHPSERDLTQTSAGTDPNVFLPTLQFWDLAAQGVLASVWALWPLSRPYLLLASNGLSSYGSDLKHRKSNWAAVLQEPEEGLLSSDRPKLRGFLLLMILIVLCLFCVGLCLEFSYPQYSIIHLKM